MAEILTGAPVAEAMIRSLIPRAEKLRIGGVTPRLAIIRLGEVGSQLAYQHSAQRMMARIGAEAECFVLAESCPQAELLALVEEINRRRDIQGCMILRPLPSPLDEQTVCAALVPEKDVDGVTPASLGAVFTGGSVGYPPCTAQACIELLEHYGIELTGKHVVLIGRSLVVGRPLSMLLQAKDATVTLCHSRSRDLPGLCQRADILVAAAGSPGLIGKEHLSPRQTVIDVGINTVRGRLCGDVRFDEAEAIVQRISPVPGGVGAVTTAVLAKHLIDAAEKTALPG